jgi:hypothetical protein
MFEGDGVPARHGFAIRDGEDDFNRCGKHRGSSRSSIAARSGHPRGGPVTQRPLRLGDFPRYTPAIPLPFRCTCIDPAASAGDFGTRLPARSTNSIVV